LPVVYRDILRLYGLQWAYVRRANSALTLFCLVMTKQNSVKALFWQQDQLT